MRRETKTTEYCFRISTFFQSNLISGYISPIETFEALVLRCHHFGQRAAG
jgi:hypothetical protein